MKDWWLPSGTTKLPTDEYPEHGPLLYQVRVEGWWTDNDPERALEQRLFFERMDFAALLRLLGCKVQTKG